MDINTLLIPRIRVKDKSLFYESVSNLLDGGVTLIPALSGFRDRTTHIGLKKEVDTLLFFVEGGDALSVAMRKLPNIFSEGEVAIIESGEQTGKLQTSFMALSRDLREQEELKGKVVNAMTYPLIILAFLVIAIIVVMVYVIPQLIPIITQVTTDLPLATELLIFTSNFIRDHFIIIFLVFTGVFLMVKGYISTEDGKYRFDNWKLTLPIVGKVYRNYLIVRIMSTLSLLLSSGITILKTLKLTGSSAGNLVIEKTFIQIIREVSHGKKIHESLKEADPYGLFFDNSILQMIESGEKTSTLNIVAEKLAVQYRREVDTSLAIMVKLIEPIALLVAGVFVLWFAIAIFSAIMQVVSTAGMN